MDIRPILSTLGRHKTAAGLIALEIALTCAIVSNAVFLIGTRLDRLAQPSGIAESELIRLAYVGTPEGTDPSALVREDLAALRALHGVQSVATTNQVPFGNSSWNTSVNLAPDQAHHTVSGSYYVGSEDLLETLGLRLTSGRDFNADEYIEFGARASTDANLPSVIISESIAERLFPGRNPLGQSIYLWNDNPVPVVGVVEHLVRPNDEGGPAAHEYTLMLPLTAPTQYGTIYLLRVDPDRRAALLEEAADLLRQIQPSRILLDDYATTLEDLRRDYYQQDRVMAWLLVSVCVALLVITALGIVGLASFWVQQRTRQIGIRRALGATRGQILGYFQTENFLIATAGIVLGMAMAFAINGMLMERYELPRLPWHYLPAGALSLWMLGQLAALGPALRAAAVPPAVATRSV